MRIALILPLLALLSGCATTDGAKGVPTRPGISAAEAALRASTSALWQADGEPYCTAAAIAPHVWLTAGHCAPRGDGETVGALRLPAVTVFENDAVDLAVVQSLATAPPLALGPPPSIGDILSTAGYGHRGGLPQLVLRAGRLLFGRLSFNGDQPSGILDLPSVHGDSGSPVADNAGRLVGVVWGFSESNRLTWAVAYSDVATVVQRYSVPSSR